MADSVLCSDCNKSIPFVTYHFHHKRVCKTKKNLRVGAADGNRPILNLASNNADYDSDTNLGSDNEVDEDQPVVRPLFDDLVWPDGFDDDVYIRKQRELYKITYGENSIYSKTLEEFRQSMMHSASIWDGFIQDFRMYDHYIDMESNISTADIENNLEFWYQQMRLRGVENHKKIVWGTLKKRVEKTIGQVVSYKHADIAYPNSWRMSEYELSKNIPNMTIRCRDPIECIALLLSDPNIAFHEDDNYLQMATYTKTLANNNRIYWDSVMSSKWAKETEAEIKLLDPAGILVPFIPYRDKVALAKMSNRTLDHAVGTIGNFGFQYRNSDSSKFS